MFKALNLPKGAKEELNYPPDVAEKVLNGLPLWDETVKTEDDDEDAEIDEETRAKEKANQLTDEQKNLLTMFGEGKYHLIPSFFRTLIYLKKNKREFSIAFRTFGTDLEKVTWEFNRFCNGQHPCYSGRNGTPLIKFDGSKGTKDLRIRDPMQKACFFRYSNEIQDTKFLQGTNVRETNDFDKINDLMNGDERYEDFDLCQDSLQIYQNILETMKKFSSMAIQDDYENWNENDQHREVSKLLLIDQADYGTQHIFFDDNADDDEDCIVDARDVISKEIISFNKMKNRYVVKVEPHRAILEPDYFIKMIEMAEQGRDDEIEKVELGLTDPNEDLEQEEKPDENEWQKL